MEDKIYNLALKYMESILGTKQTNTLQLNEVGKKLFGKKFKGVFPSDKIPILTNKTPYAILNLDKSFQFGSHWIGIAKKGNTYHVYDSFGRKSFKIIPSMFAGGRIVLDTEDDAEQSKKQENCGQRVLAWLFVFDQFGKDVAMKI